MKLYFAVSRRTQINDTFRVAINTNFNYTQLLLNSTICLIVFLLFAQSGFSQQVTLNDIDEDESALYAETKQLNQFIRRFNGEEDVKGNRIYEDNSDFRSVVLRNKYIHHLYNKEQNGIDKTFYNKFATQVLNSESPEYVDFYAGNWFAEIHATIRYEGKNQDITFFMIIEEENEGYKWVFEKIWFEPFAKLFYPNEARIGLPQFIHPMSHELDFMNLAKFFRSTSHIEFYADKFFEPDYLTLFIYELKKKNIKFVGTKSVKFHFFQIENWYFEVSSFNRKGYNTGWLISNLISVPEREKQNLLKMIYND